MYTSLSEEPTWSQHKALHIASSHTTTTEDCSESSFGNDELEFAIATPDQVCTSELPQRCSSRDLEDDDDDDDSYDGEVDSRRTIQFSALVTVCETIHLNDFTQDEKHACWYQRDQFVAIREQAQDTLDLWESGELTGDALLSVRGLENFTDDGAASADMNYYHATVAVLHEQELTDDWQAIARSYRKATLRCRFPARQRALQDRKDVEQILRGN